MKKAAKKPLRAPKGGAVTMDDLARMMASGFSEMGVRMDGRFDEVHERIDELDERLSGQMRVLDDKIGIVNANVLSLQYDYRKVVARIENLEFKTFGSVQEP